MFLFRTSPKNYVHAMYSTYRISYYMLYNVSVCVCLCVCTRTLYMYVAQHNSTNMFLVCFCVYECKWKRCTMQTPLSSRTQLRRNFRRNFLTELPPKTLQNSIEILGRSKNICDVQTHRIETIFCVSNCIHWWPPVPYRSAHGYSALHHVNWNTMRYKTFAR